MVIVFNCILLYIIQLASKIGGYEDEKDIVNNAIINLFFALSIFLILINFIFGIKVLYHFLPTLAVYLNYLSHYSKKYRFLKCF